MMNALMEVTASGILLLYAWIACFMLYYHRPLVRVLRTLTVVYVCCIAYIDYKLKDPVIYGNYIEAFKNSYLNIFNAYAGDKDIKIARCFQAIISYLGI